MNLGEVYPVCLAWVSRFTAYSLHQQTSGLVDCWARKAAKLRDLE